MFDDNKLVIVVDVTDCYQTIEPYYIVKAVLAYSDDIGITRYTNMTYRSTIVPDLYTSIGMTKEEFINYIGVKN